MVLIPSTMLPLGTKASDFTLADPRGKKVSLKDVATGAPATLIVFMCNHCPYVKHLKKEFSTLAKKYQEKGVVVIGINSNDVTNYPEDSPERMAKEIEEFGYTFPYLLDTRQEVAKSYRATCTLDFYLFDKNFALVYRGQFDDSRPGNNRPVTGADLRASLEAVLANRPPLSKQHPSIGCNIKWRAGNEPDYFG